MSWLFMQEGIQDDEEQAEQLTRFGSAHFE